MRLFSAPDFIHGLLEMGRGWLLTSAYFLFTQFSVSIQAETSSFPYTWGLTSSQVTKVDGGHWLWKFRGKYMRRKLIWEKSPQTVLLWSIAMIVVISFHTTDFELTQMAQQRNPGNTRNESYIKSIPPRRHL